MMSSSRSVVALIGLFAGLLLIADVARAVPRYSARYGQKCGLCHVNPSGGGLRTPYASQFLVPQEIAWSTPEESILDGIDPQIAKNVLIGTDFRMIHTKSDDDAVGRGFFQMQGDIYLNFQMDDQLSLYYDQGISSTYELFGMWQGLPLTGYVKAGRFVPSYGWRFDDHTMAVREDLGFMPPANSDVGVEFGLSPARLDAQVALVNGNRGSTFDDDQRIAVVLNAIYRGDIASVGWAAGLSGYWHDAEAGDDGAAGFYGYLMWRRLTWLAEVDWFRVDPAGAGHTTGLVTSHEFSFLARQGLELLATYDFRDPDWNYTTGSSSRYGGGVSIMPRSFLVAQALLRATRYTHGADVSDDDYWETVLQLHLLY